MTSSHRIVPPRRIPALLLAATVALACAPKNPPILASLCSGGSATAHISATIDTVRPPAGPELVAAKGSRFDLRFTFAAPSAGASATDCAGTKGTAIFSGTLPDRIRTATSSAGTASWRIDGDTVLLDLNPGTRDNNVFVVLPLHGGRGHWGLSTFAGEVAGGATAFLP
jgi:hypothetical protein